MAGVKHFLSRGYTYDQHPPPARYPLESFLFTHKVGYCQQFSGAMAMLLRMGGIPARVAAGFTTGVPERGHTWQVSDTDAHAWVEAWFPRYGWVRFDPTPTERSRPRGQRAGSDRQEPRRGLSGSQTIAAPRREIGVKRTGRGGDAEHRLAPLSPWLVAPALLVLAALGRLAWILLHPSGFTEQLLAELRRAMARTGGRSPRT